MGAVVSDILETRLDLVGLGAFSSGLGSAGTAFGVFDRDAIRANARLQTLVGTSVATGAAALALANQLKEAGLAAGEDAAEFERAGRNFKGAFPAGEVEEFSGKLERLTGVADENIASTLGLLGTFQVTRSAAEQLAEPILNATEALKGQGATSEQIAVQVGKALQTGEPTALRRSGIILDEVAFKAASAEGRLQLLTKALNDQGGATAARDALKTLPGQIRAMETATNGVKEAIGKGLVGPFVATAGAVKDLAYWFQGLPGPVHAGATVLAVTMVGALAATSIGTAIAAYQTVRLAKAHLEAAAAAKTQSTAEGGLNRTLQDGALKSGAAAAKKGIVAKAGEFLQSPVRGGAGGLTGKVGKFLGTKGGAIAGIAASIAADVALNALPDEGLSGDFKRVGNRALAGAGTGALIGSVVPGLGTAAGGLIGATIGVGAGLFEDLQKPKTGSEAAHLEEAKKQTALLEKQNDLLEKAAAGGAALDTSLLPAAAQLAAMQFGRVLR